MRLARWAVLLWCVITAAPLTAQETSLAAPVTAKSVRALIDRHLEAAWETRSLVPAPPADDATFLRRVSLDLIGRVASVAETRRFLRDAAKDKRPRLVRRWLGSPEHARHMARHWRRLWIPEADTQTFEELAVLLEPWLVDRLLDNERYDQLVRELLVASAGPDTAAIAPGDGHAAPPVFAAASSNSPANLAANTSRAFLGVNLGCAQCHDHPDGRWTRQQFWQTAAFFAPPAVNPAGGDVALPPRLTIAQTGRVVEAVFLNGERPQWSRDVNRDAGRLALADWMTQPDNPYFARNAVNRLWAKFFGRALVEPVDDLTAAETARHTRLLDELAAALTASGFDLRLLTEAIVLSRPYQLAASPPPAPREDDGSGGEPAAGTDGGAGVTDVGSVASEWFTAMPVRGLTGEQLYDSLRTASGFAAERDDLHPGRARRERESFADRFAVAEPVLAERSIAQTLTLFNGQPVARFTSPRQSPLLIALLEAPFLGTEGRLETLFLATLNRPPEAAERAEFTDYLQAATTNATDPDRFADRFADIFWVLINSSEFNSNH